MKISERIAALDRLQHDRTFKLIATVVVLVAAEKDGEATRLGLSQK